MTVSDNLHFVTQKQDVFSVSRLNQAARLLLEGQFAHIWVEGELSNVATPSSGHIYFTLKDDKAQVRCAMFRHKNQLLDFTPSAGMQVLLRGKVSLYEGRGDFQLLVESMQEAGDGALQRAFNLLKKRLAEEGLFAAEKKKNLPTLPRCIGVITSPTGAAIRDVLSVLRRRFPAIPVIIYPSEVQGKQAAGQIQRAIQTANQRQECDVLLLTRGGGSLEDLWPFNEEIVARAIAASHLPIVSGVGHEVDVTIADFVADCRAATPSAAAELISPDGMSWLATYLKHEQSLVLAIRRLLQNHQQHLDFLERRLQHPGQRLKQQRQQCAQLAQRLLRSTRRLLQHRAQQVQHASARLQQFKPEYQLQVLTQRLQDKYQRLCASIKVLQHDKQQHLANVSRALHNISPLATLSRGYAIVCQDDSIIKQASDVTVNDEVTTRLARGRLRCRVLETMDE